MDPEGADDTGPRGSGVALNGRPLQISSSEDPFGVLCNRVYREKSYNIQCPSNTLAKELCVNTKLKYLNSKTYKHKYT